MLTMRIRYAIFIILHLSCVNVLCISEMPNSLLVEMQGVNSTKDFYEKFVDGGYKTFRGDRIGLSDGAVLDEIGKAEEMIGNCQPLETTVKVSPPSNPTWFTHPECVKIKQCGGCCGSLSTACQPIKTKARNYRVSRFKYNRDKRLLELVNDEIYNLNEHITCGCQCKVKASDCTKNQVYDERVCECICKNSQEISDCVAADKTWDAKRCNCICKEIEECSSGYFFNPITCRCHYVES